MNVYAVLLVVSICALGVAEGRRVKRVVGGKKYEAGAYPFSVSLWYMGSNNVYTENTPDLHHTCGGTLITKNWVLAAALCFDDNFLPGLSNLTLWHVVLGMYGQKTARDDAQFREIEYVVTSPIYNLSAAYGDVALLRLSTPADLSPDSVGVIDYNQDDDCPDVDEGCTVIGWGQVEESPYGDGSNFPHEAEVNIVSLPDCEDAYLTENVTAVMGPLKMDKTTLCAGVQGGGRDACAGDSGSPLLCECGSDDSEDSLTVCGIVSYGYGCARAGYPGVYSRVSAFSDFISDTIEADP